MLDRFRSWVARRISPTPARPAHMAQRMYHAARPSRLTGDFPSSTSSADAELNGSLALLRNRSRALVRDVPYARRAKAIVVGNVIGGGMGLQAKVESSRGQLRDNVNDDIESAWEEWAEAGSCHTGGQLHFSDLERAAMGQVFEAGEVLIRMHFGKFGDSKVPLALELIEPECLAEEWSVNEPTADGHMVRMGVEVDRFHRPVAYFIRRRHPGDMRFRFHKDNDFERVPASQIFHLRLIDRWPQTRGEPWLCSIVRKLHDMEGYSEAEITAARASAAYVAFVQFKDGTQNDPLGSTEAGSGADVLDMQPGMIEKLGPNEEIVFNNPTRPNTAIDPFMRYMLRECAAGVLGVSYESLSRDFGQVNYSSGRLALIDDRDLWKALQAWFIRSFRKPLYREWLSQAVMSRAVKSIGVDEYAMNTRKFESVSFKPRGWSWVDPTKEVEAFKEAIKAGFTTVTDVIAATSGGQDIEDVIATRKREIAMFEAAGINLDTLVPDIPEPAPPGEPPPKKEDAPPQEPAAERVLHFRR
jgi:lambda family phage portal protein